MIQIFPILEKDQYILMGQNNQEGHLFLHFEWKGEAFSKSTYLSLLEDWNKILDCFRAMGIGEVFSAIPHAWSKERKWQTMFGLSPHLENDNAVIYRLEI